MERNIWYDLVRGLSALAVCLSHLRNALFVDYAQIEQPNLALKLFYFVSGLGHESVMVFFVLSGFFVGGSVLNRKSSFSWDLYLRARLTRLWVVLIPALLLTGAVDTLIYFDSPEVLEGVYTATWNSGPTPERPYTADFTTFVGNVFFVQTILVPIFGSNAPLWSLSNEFWYYLILPSILLLFRAFQKSRPNNAQLLTAVIILLVSMFLLQEKKWMGFGVWMLGVGLWCLPSINRYQKTCALAGGLFFLVMLAISKTTSSESKLIDLAVGGSFVFLAWPLRSMKLGVARRLSIGLSEISYSLYVFHFPVIVLIAGMLYQGTQLQPTAGAFLELSAWMLFIVLGSSVFWWMFEKRTPAIRGWIDARFRRRDA